MTKRHEYSLDLSELDQRRPPMAIPDLQVKAIEVADVDGLAELMLEAYRGTIDYDDETLQDAIHEVQAYLSGERGGRPLLDVARLAFADSRLVGACLAADWHIKQLPLIAYVMTHAEWKNRGVGKQVLWGVLKALRDQGHHEVRAVITEGNTPSERLFSHMGFQKVRLT